ncbi:multidrug transport protein [Lactobacillus plantarum JDM1] [Lactiplantibacillus mudanjiangensis]|nr:multidrug transport protein [Lactobacillus plantarum JDM1] [Lactiplantibacillus mudanjiangensis]
MKLSCVFFFFQAEDGIRASSTSRGLGDVYKRQGYHMAFIVSLIFCAIGFGLTFFLKSHHSPLW